MTDRKLYHIQVKRIKIIKVYLPTDFTDLH